MILIRTTTLGIILLVIQTSADPGHTFSSVSGSNELRMIVQGYFPKERIVESNDIDSKSCQVASHPGWIEADFNGDGLRDYAVLLKGSVKQKKEWHGRELQLMEVKLVAFVQEAARGRFRSIVLDSFEEYYPLGVDIDIQPKGWIREPPSIGHKAVELKNPGILQYFCEKSASVFYWDKKTNKFKRLWVGD